MAKKLHERARTTLIVCRLFGYGFVDDDTWTNGAVDALLLAANLVATAVGFDHVTSVMQLRTPVLWDITMVMMVTRVYAYLLTPPLMMFTWWLNKRSLVAVVRRLDDAVPLSGRKSLRPFARYAAAWLTVSVCIEWTSFSLFHFDTDFAYFTPYEYPMIFVYRTWTAVPVCTYIFLVDTVRLGLCDINGRVTSIGAWTAHRDRWKELVGTATRLAKADFGVVIVAFVVCSIAEVVFCFFSLYFVGHKTNKSPREMAVFTVNALFVTSWMSEVFRVSQNCKSEMLKTQKILSSVNIDTKKDYKELKYASLHMLHMDFNFTPCGIFKMSYRSLVSIATLIAAFLVFQIQMKLQ